MYRFLKSAIVICLLLAFTACSSIVPAIAQALPLNDAVEAVAAGQGAVLETLAPAPEPAALDGEAPEPPAADGTLPAPAEALPAPEDAPLPGQAGPLADGPHSRHHLSPAAPDGSLPEPPAAPVPDGTGARLHHPEPHHHA